MPINRYHYQSGLSLIEAIVFIIVVSVSLSALLYVFNESVVKTTDPALRIQSLEKAQALMDEILARKFDENTPTGGIPACDSASGVVCAGIASDTDYDDVGDYNGYSDNTNPLFTVSVVVVNAGTDLGLTASQARRITITSLGPSGKSISLTSYKVNF